jgi:hypothetical protein
MGEREENKKKPNFMLARICYMQRVKKKRNKKSIEERGAYRSEEKKVF